MLVWFIYLHSATVTLLSFLHKTVPAHRGSHQTFVGWFVQQAAGAAACQVSLVVTGAAAAESLRNIPAEEKKTHIFLINCHIL